MTVDNKFFNASKLGDRHKIVFPNGQERYFADASDSYANNGFYISFEHVPSEQEVAFKAFINSFQENYNCDWAEESVYGRPDPIYTYRGTNRRLAISFLIPAATMSEGFENLATVQKLMQFLYPTYTGVQNAQTISQSPLVRMRLMNLFANRSPGAAESPTPGYLNSPATYNDLLSSDKESMWQEGLLGAISSVNVNHNLDNPDAGVFEFAPGVIVPKLIEINLDFSVIHEHAVGWDQNKNFSQPLFPYGVDLQGSKPADGTTLAEQERELAIASQKKREERQADTGKDISQQVRDNLNASYNSLLDRMTWSGTGGTTTRYWGPQTQTSTGLTEGPNIDGEVVYEETTITTYQYITGDGQGN